MDLPSMRISPSSGSSSPMMCLSKTLLPPPLGPITTKISPRSTSKFSPLSTGWPSKLRRRLRTVTRTPCWGMEAGAFIGWSIEIHQEARHEIVQDQDQHDGVDHRLGHGAADAPWTADGLEALMTGDHADDDGKNESLEQSVDDFAQVHQVAEIAEISGKADADPIIVNGHQRAPHPTHHDGKNHQDWQGATDRDQPWQHQVMNRIDVHGAEGVDFLIDAHRTDLSGHG